MSGLTDSFYGNVCVVCRQPAVCHIKCTDCNMIAYCSDLHRTTHKIKHKHLCSVIQNVASIVPKGDLHSKTNWYRYRTQFTMLCELLLQRKLKGGEMNMILFPRACEVCHQHLVSLVDCKECLCVCYCCEDHQLQDKVFHDGICQSLLMCRRLDLGQYRSPAKWHLCEKNLNICSRDMKSFIANNIVMSKNDSLQVALISESLTCPLTLAYGASLVEFTFCLSLVIHVVGSELLEWCSLPFWEVIAHWQPQVEVITVIFIGPASKSTSNVQLELCEGCAKLTINIKNYKMLYQDYVNSAEFTKPDLVAAFNCGFHEFEGTEADTWLPSFPHLVTPAVPLILTSFTKIESEKDVSCVAKSCSNLLFQTQINPFSSLHPLRDLEDLGIYFNNGYISVITTPS